MKIRLKSLSVTVLAPVVIFMVLSTFCFIMIRMGVSWDLGNQQMVLLDNTMHGTFGTIAERRAQLGNAIKTYAVGHERLSTAIMEQNEEALTKELDEAQRLMSANGYILTDASGDVLCTSFSNVNHSALSTVVDHVLQEGSASACGNFLTDMICDYSAQRIMDEMGQPAGVLIVVGFIATDHATLSQISEKLNSDFFIFVEDRCIYSSIDSLGKGNKNLVPDPDARRASYELKQPWKGVSTMLGEKNYLCSVPLLSFDGTTFGFIILHVKSDITKGIVENINTALISILAVFVLLFIFLIYRLRLTTIKPLLRIGKDVERIATGDLTVTMDYSKTCDEIDELGENIERMAQRIRSVIKPILETTSALGIAADQLNAASESLSNQANRQAASLEEISSSMEEMGANIQQNTDNSVHTSKLADEMNQMAMGLSKAAKTSYDAIGSIANNINDINDLVSQTNILALNASVEAARAGEHGQGFGVVAKEVGRLAEQTHDTAEHIGQTAESSIHEAEEAFAHVQQLTPRIEKITALVKEITTASIEQNSGVSQVNSAIMELNRSTQQNAAGAEEIAANTQQMRDTINDVITAISVFKV